LGWLLGVGYAEESTTTTDVLFWNEVIQADQFSPSFDVLDLQLAQLSFVLLHSLILPPLSTPCA
jgi:hypothetical protein